MKKKNADKPAEMPEFTFREFTPEEDRVYAEAMDKYREAITAGKALRQAYESYAITSDELRALIQADFLKIMIAERHFAARQPLEQLAKDFDVSLDLIKDTVARMLQEVGVSAANHFGQQFGGIAPKTSD